MIRSLSISALIILFCQVTTAQVAVQNLLIENQSNPIGLDVDKPRFSWQLVSEKRNVMQTAYEIKVLESTNSKRSLWASGKISSDQSVHVTYGGPALQSGKRYYWQVRVWDNYGKTSAWSATAFWQMALLQASDWKAKWIQPAAGQSGADQPNPIFRKKFSTEKKIQSAMAYITAHGLYEAHLNGQRIGDAYLTPGWTSYNKRLQYQVYDVTNLVRQGQNAIGATLGNGWYRGFIGFDGQKDFYGKDIALLFQLEITYADGSVETIVSDGSWKSSTGSISSSEIYNGEIIDARNEKAGWNSTAYDDSAWAAAEVSSFHYDNLIATYNEPIRKHEIFPAKKIFTTPAGEKVIDFGQNLVGWVIVKANGKAGNKITISHAEVLDKEGNFYTTNLRAAKSQDTYFLKGGKEETFEPHFTFHGFRYIKVEGYPGELKPENFTAVTLYSDMKKSGTFETSNALLNQLQHNIQWGQRGNFLDVPTDCPQRDERLGWTGDAQAFSRAAAFNFNVNNFFAKWLKDVEADQGADGSVPFVIPNVLKPHDAGSAGWADAATIIPWNMYRSYGDKRILEAQYESMKAWVRFMQSRSTNDLWNKGFHFGDWLFYRPHDDNDGRAAVTDKYLIAQCFYAHSTQLVINTARVLGKTDDVNLYSALLQKIKGAFLKEYVTPSGRLVSSTQTAYVLALNFDMLPENLRAQAAQKLADNVKDYGNHLTTGFLGTPYLCHVLSRFGYGDVAFALLTQESYPSWLYPVKMGATTIWERWDGLKPDGTFQVPSMNSFNHYAYGAIGDWMYHVVAGLDNDDTSVGYKQIRIKPLIGGGLTYATATLETYYGKTSSGWKKENDGLVLNVTIPPNTSGKIYVPATNASQITERGKPLSTIKEIKIAELENGYVVLEMGSGSYALRVK
jgi:alpha-L-rhamnosidase